jgi:ATP-dependent exoDNAse (exonuclease V) alpha subunit
MIGLHRNSITDHGAPRKVVVLTRKVMVLTNVSVADGGSNGSIGRVIGLHRNFITDRIQLIVVQMDSGDVRRLGETYVLRKYAYQGYMEKMSSPLRLAYATTVHKVQGATLPRTIMYLRNAFNPEFFVVAISRSHSRDTTKIAGAINASRAKPAPETPACPETPALHC